MHHTYSSPKEDQTQFEFVRDTRMKATQFKNAPPGTFFQCAQAAVDNHLKKLSGSTWKVYLFLCRLADGNNGTCYPSLETIAERCGICKRTAQTAIQDLCHTRTIQKLKRPNQSNVYRIVFGGDDYSPPSTASQPKPSVEPQDGSNSLPCQAKSSGNSKPQEWQQVATYQTSLTNQEQTLGLGKVKKNRPAGGSWDATQLLEHFNRWWQTYPRKTQRKKAEEAFIHAVRDLVEGNTDLPHPEITTIAKAVDHLVTQARAYAQAVQGRRYIKYPANWLREQCFDDEMTLTEKEYSVTAICEHFKNNGYELVTE